MTIRSNLFEHSNMTSIMIWPALPTRTFEILQCSWNFRPRKSQSTRLVSKIPSKWRELSGRRSAEIPKLKHLKLKSQDLGNFSLECFIFGKKTAGMHLTDCHHRAAASIRTDRTARHHSVDLSPIPRYRLRDFFPKSFAFTRFSKPVLSIIRLGSGFWR